MSVKNINNSNSPNGLRNQMCDNNLCETKQIYVNSNGLAASGKKINFFIPAHSYGSKQVNLVSNPLMIFTLNEQIDLEFDTLKIFNTISFEIGGIQIDKLHGAQIEIYQKIYGLEPMKIGNKVFIPIPINCLLKSNGILASKLKYFELRLWIEFLSNPIVNCIEDTKIRFDLDILAVESDYDKICKRYIDNLITNIGKSKHKQYYLDNKPDFNKTQIVGFKQNFFTGFENFALLNQNDKVRIKCNCYGELETERFFIYFVNSQDGNIYKSKPFDTITFWSNGENVLEIDYETLVYENLESNLSYKLPKGVYEIKWKNIINYVPEQLIIELKGLELPDANICFNIFGECVNYLIYHDGKCEMMVSN